ncbi:hypothetical protein EUTSA_v10020782mg [Eutrema salsugineum]|uniref:Uncharacterized protein n=1 Tax=Eutrema salsugineum TaxID=72664 RepID=V4M6A5_EUTSA|nr:uncharacterized protein LOC18024887 [Eutrema salsugineum]ESQ47858.1 hypothetical protein EUTSA_v10020782mg [Eutrema salsugineum]
MDFLKVRKFRKSRKPNLEKEKQEQELARSENTVAGVTDSAKADEIEDDDDDFITNEVKRRLKELRRNSFMVLIPEEDEEEEEESYLGEDEGEDKCSSEWRDVVAEGLQWWGGFDAVYEKYCERMLFFDRLSSQQLKETGIGIAPSPSTPSPRSASKKLSSPFRCLSLKKTDVPEEDIEHLQEAEMDPYQDLEIAYVAQLCLTWEALHCQYTQLSHLISCQPETQTCYNHTAQHFQQFLVLLQRYIENEPFEQGTRAELYARARNAMPKLLQAPKIQGSDKKEMEKDTDFMVIADDLIKIIESSILTFNVFLKMDKKKPNGVIHLFGNHNNNHMNSTTPLQLVQSSVEKKRVKAKELSKKTKGLRNKSWPQTWEGVQLLFAAIDIKLASRVLRMAKISKEHLLWCEEKMKKLDFSLGKLQRHPSPILFPC